MLLKNDNRKFRQLNHWRGDSENDSLKLKLISRNPVALGGFRLRQIFGN